MIRQRLTAAANRTMLVAIAAIVAALASLEANPPAAEALYEDIYSLPFHSDYDITCSWGPYSNCGLSGNHNGTDYSLG
jgi:hypothetical protein